MTSVKPNCLRDKSSVSSIAPRVLHFARTRTHLRACVSLALSSAAARPVIRNYVDGQIVSSLLLSFPLRVCMRVSLFRYDSSGFPVADTRVCRLTAFVAVRLESTETHFVIGSEKLKQDRYIIRERDKFQLLDRASSTLLAEMRDVLRSVFRVKAAHEESRDSRSLRHTDEMLAVGHVLGIFDGRKKLQGSKDSDLNLAMRELASSTARCISARTLESEISSCDDLCSRDAKLRERERERERERVIRE